MIANRKAKDRLGKAFMMLRDVPKHWKIEIYGQIYRPLHDNALTQALKDHAAKTNSRFFIRESSETRCLVYLDHHVEVAGNCRQYLKAEEMEQRMKALHSGMIEVGKIKG